MGSYLRREIQWLIQGQISYVEEEGMSVQIRDMLPMDVANKLVSQIPDDMKFADVDDCTKVLKVWE